MLSATYDETKGIVRTVADGLATIEQFQDFVTAVMPMMDKSRQHNGRGLHLVDARNNPIQSQEAFGHMAAMTEQIARPDDRYAVVISSTLAKMQLGRMPMEEARGFFFDLDEAENWLLGQCADVKARATH